MTRPLPSSILSVYIYATRAEAAVHYENLDVSDGVALASRRRGLFRVLRCRVWAWREYGRWLQVQR